MLVNSAGHHDRDRAPTDGTGRAHGLADGSLVADPSFFADDVARFGDLPGVSVRDIMSMSPSEIQAVLEGPGTIIGGFCESGACLAPYRG